MSKKSKKMSKQQFIIYIITLIVILILAYTGENSEENTIATNVQNKVEVNYSMEDIPEYEDKVYIEINNNEPFFEEDEYSKEGFEIYSELDELGRCGIAYANICKEIMPKEGQTRESISRVKPSGWQQTKIGGEYIYNRCHLIAFQLADENANEKNLITGTRYFNTEGMLPFENKVANYIKQNPDNHVLYRITPNFKGDNLVVNGIEMEAYSIEDNGQGIKFNIYVYNVQPGATIDYATGKVTEN